MARIFVPKNISESGTLLVWEEPAEITADIKAAKQRRDEFIKVTIDDGTSTGRSFALKTSLIQAYE